ncbi:hypothetical protein Trco_008405 [Trichoderma cornu-damae]|uniref:Pyoverdine biosynthesis n=1 Tax=Trichoderma cornu-damae TaxID=654480 RepID=A0A9P8QIP0_9HYPO|nr:hypothetical protein Trco_008405 [Trichoderma cornu-damae]
MAEIIVDYFDRTLRHISQTDEWDVGGRQYFLQTVKYFTSRGQKIEFCLPAFPCKSSNLNKVQGVQPDRGEYIALTNLNQFIKHIGEIYSPGAKLWIISDGHVFSDCKIARLLGGEERIEFKSLLDIFNLKNPQARPAQGGSLENLIPAIAHHIPTKLEQESELCRRILMMGFQTDSNDLRRRIDSQNASTLALYRGFSKFMLEDLDQNVYTKDLSRTRRRKLSSKVAFEMIQWYSHITFVCRFMHGSLMESSDLLHVPTPWHNCVAEIDGHANIYVTKSIVVRSALSGGEFSGGPAGTFDQKGRYFHLVALPSAASDESQNTSPTMTDYEVTPSNTGRRVVPAKEAEKLSSKPRALKFFKQVRALIKRCIL